MTMDVKLSLEQEVLLNSVRGILERHRLTNPFPGPSSGDYAALLALRENGFLDILQSGGSAVEVVLVIEAAAAFAPGAPVGAQSLVGPLVTLSSLGDIVGLAESRRGSLTRFACDASSFLYLDGVDARHFERGQVEVAPVDTRWGFPVGRVTPLEGSTAQPVDAGMLVRTWRIALAAEIGGLMEAATLLASKYVSERFQFGKSIGSIQTVQHRLARAHVASQATKWLARRAAWDLHDDRAAAAAACYASSEASGVLASVQQVCGAIGFTDEFGLTRFTARLQMLQTELGGPSTHARWLARSRWPVPFE